MSGCTCSVTSSESTPLCTDSNEALQCQIWAGAAAGIHFLVLSRVVWLTLQQVALKSLGSKYRSSKGILSSVAISCFSLCKLVMHVIDLVVLSTGNLPGALGVRLMETLFVQLPLLTLVACFNLLSFVWATSLSKSMESMEKTADSLKFGLMGLNGTVAALIIVITFLPSLHTTMLFGSATLSLANAISSGALVLHLCLSSVSLYYFGSRVIRTLVFNASLDPSGAKTKDSIDKIKRIAYPVPALFTVTVLGMAASLIIAPGAIPSLVEILLSLPVDFTQIAAAVIFVRNLRASDQELDYIAARALGKGASVPQLKTKTSQHLANLTLSKQMKSMAASMEQLSQESMNKPNSLSRSPSAGSHRSGSGKGSRPNVADLFRDSVISVDVPASEADDPEALDKDTTEPTNQAVAQVASSPRLKQVPTPAVPDDGVGDIVIDVPEIITPGPQLTPEMMEGQENTTQVTKRSSHRLSGAFTRVLGLEDRPIPKHPVQPPSPVTSGLPPDLLGFSLEVPKRPRSISNSIAGRPYSTSTVATSSNVAKEFGSRGEATKDMSASKASLFSTQAAAAAAGSPSSRAASISRTSSKSSTASSSKPPLGLKNSSSATSKGSNKSASSLSRGSPRSNSSRLSMASGTSIPKRPPPVPPAAASASPLTKTELTAAVARRASIASSNSALQRSVPDSPSQGSLGSSSKPGLRPSSSQVSMNSSKSVNSSTGKPVMRSSPSQVSLNSSMSSRSGRRVMRSPSQASIASTASSPLARGTSSASLNSSAGKTNPDGSPQQQQQLPSLLPRPKRTHSRGLSNSSSTSLRKAAHSRGPSNSSALSAASLRSIQSQRDQEQRQGPPAA